VGKWYCVANFSEAGAHSVVGRAIKNNAGFASGFEDREWRLEGIEVVDGILRVINIASCPLREGGRSSDIVGATCGN
jgi:hypothetical protein